MRDSSQSSFELEGLIRQHAQRFPETLERYIHSHGRYRRIAGVDEVGRGPLAGPVVACACVFSEGSSIGVDSKTLTEAGIIRWYERLVSTPGLIFAVAQVESEVIDRVNIAQATLLAMRQAVRGLAVPADMVLVDGARAPQVSCPVITIVKGDQHCMVIGAASIIAKYTRDAVMRAYDQQYPQYGFARHKGYGTVAHIEMLRRYGPSPIHRKSFDPVKELCASRC